MSAVVSVWDDASSSWKTWNGSTGDLSNGLIAPYQGFWIQASGGTGSITIQDADISSTETSFYGRSMNNDSLKVMSFEVTYGQKSAITYFSFAQEGSVDIDNGDSRKILPLQATPRLEIMSYSGETPLKINNLPHQIESSINIPMEILILDIQDDNFVTQEGEVDFKWNINDIISTMEIDIFDNYTGETINLNSIGTTGLHNFEIFESGSFPYQSSSINSQYPSLVNPRFQIILNHSNIKIDNEPEVPNRLSVNKVYPNPFNPSLKVEIEVENASEIKLTIFNLNGTSVETRNVSFIESGVHEIVWAPGQIASGVYILKIDSKRHSFTEKITFIK